MGETEIIVFIVLISLAIVAFIVVTVALVVQYRKRKIVHEHEKKAASELHKNELLNVQVEVQEETMQHIGVEIHDSIAQKLTLASLHLQQVEYENKYPDLNQTLIVSSTLINESLDDLRLLSRRLLKNGEEKTDIVASLQRECERVKQLQLCQVHFEADSTGAIIGTQVANTLLRIVQEFVQNSLKHSGCKNIFLQLNTKTDPFVLTVRDDGRGFNINQPPNTNGIGLNSIRKRAGIIGATLTQESTPGNGASITLTLSKNSLF